MVIVFVDLTDSEKSALLVWRVEGVVTEDDDAMSLSSSGSWFSWSSAIDIKGSTLSSAYEQLRAALLVRLAGTSNDTEGRLAP